MMKSLICYFPALPRIPYSIPMPLFRKPQKTTQKCSPLAPAGSQTWAPNSLLVAPA